MIPADLYDSLRVQPRSSPPKLFQSHENDKMSTQANPADRAQQSVHSMKQQAQKSYGAARQTVADKAQQSVVFSTFLVRHSLLSLRRAHENMVKPAFERYLDMAQRKPLMTVRITLRSRNRNSALIATRFDRLSLRSSS